MDSETTSTLTPRRYAVGDQFSRGGGSGFKAHVRERHGDWMLMSITHAELTGICSWEVVRLRQVPERSINGVRYPSGDQLPSSEEWGSRGWTYRTEQAAREVYRRRVGARAMAESALTSRGTGRTVTPQ